ncbi:hypothetical protein AAVH_12195 [Aphelenchoides avenae]|nr:hypothetical protein AAVH_12195 [Aphelenchus avenae]
MFSSAGDFEVDQEKSAARAAAPTSLFPFFANPAMALAANAARLPVATTSAATSSPSTTPNISTTFPTMMHTAFFQQMLQAMQFNRQPGALAAATPDSNNGSMVESRSSSTTGSPSTTKRKSLPILIRFRLLRRVVFT